MFFLVHVWTSGILLNIQPDFFFLFLEFKTLIFLKVHQIQNIFVSQKQQDQKIRPHRICTPTSRGYMNVLSLGIQHTVSQSFFLILTASKNKSADDVFIPSLRENKPCPYFIQFQKVTLQVKIASWHQAESSLQRNRFQQSPSLRPTRILGRNLVLRNRLWSFPVEVLQRPE